MKKVVAWGMIFVLTLLFLLFGVSTIICAEEEQKPIFEPIERQMMPCFEEAPSAQEIMDVLVTESEDIRINGFEITYDEAQELMRIAMAEAGGEGIQGKAMVMAVVLNRVDDTRFPDNIHDVIFQDKQFSPIADGRYWEVEPDEECHLALAEIEQGEYFNTEALYFENAGECWQSKHCEFLGKIGHHKFYK